VTYGRREGKKNSTATSVSQVYRKKKEATITITIDCRSAEKGRRKRHDRIQHPLTSLLIDAKKRERGGKPATRDKKVGTQAIGEGKKKKKKIHTNPFHMREEKGWDCSANLYHRHTMKGHWEAIVKHRNITAASKPSFFRNLRPEGGKGGALEGRVSTLIKRNQRKSGKS